MPIPETATILWPDIPELVADVGTVPLSELGPLLAEHGSITLGRAIGDGGVSRVHVPPGAVYAIHGGEIRMLQEEPIYDSRGESNSFFVYGGGTLFLVGTAIQFGRHALETADGVNVCAVDCLMRDAASDGVSRQSSGGLLGLYNCRLENIAIDHPWGGDAPGQRQSPGHGAYVRGPRRVEVMHCDIEAQGVAVQLKHQDQVGGPRTEVHHIAHNRLHGRQWMLYVIQGVRFHVHDNEGWGAAGDYVLRVLASDGRFYGNSYRVSADSVSLLTQSRYGAPPEPILWAPEEPLRLVLPEGVESVRVRVGYDQAEGVMSFPDRADYAAGETVTGTTEEGETVALATVEHAAPPPPPGRVVVEIRSASDLETLELYKTEPVEAHFLVVVSAPVLLRGYVDLIVRDFDGQAIDTPREDGQAALMIDRCGRVQVEGASFSDCTGAGLYIGPNAEGDLCVIDVRGLFAERLGWNAANLYKCTGQVTDTQIRQTNQGTDGSWDTGGVKITRCKRLVFENYDSAENVGADLWIDHGNEDIRVERATVQRLLIEKSIRTTVVESVIRAGEEEPDAVQLRAAPETTFEWCVIESERKEKFVLAGNVPEVVDGVEYLTVYTRFVDTVIRGPKFTISDPFNFRLSGDSKAAIDEFYDTLDDEGLTWEPTDGPVEPPVPPDTECGCKEVLDVLIAEMQALRATQEALRDDHAQLSAQIVALSQKMDRPLVPIDGST